MKIHIICVDSNQTNQLDEVERRADGTRAQPNGNARDVGVDLDVDNEADLGGNQRQRSDRTRRPGAQQDGHNHGE